ncbi:MAG: HEAT repeat domain-containing protein [Deltaproteobacteria bacterium]|nr:HEAT repeat domain-containing protein [Deltaproteobacteria bacterium]MBI2229222.1 HEAT repeat domain-containing protein [Deltaproteobacteria bacterium]
MNDDKIAALIADLDHSDKPRIRAAVDALIPLAAAAPALADELNRLLNDSQRKHQWPAAYILAHLPDPSQRVFAVLLNALGHSDPDIRWAVMLLLVRLAKTDNGIVGLLLELRETGTPTQRRMALYCIRDFNLTDAASLQALLDSLRDDDPTVRVAAATSLKARTDIDSGARRTLCDLFVNDPDSRVRNAAAVTLAQSGSPSEEFLAALKMAEASEHAQVKKAATAALAILKKAGLKTLG